MQELNGGGIQASLDRELPAFAAYVPPPQTAAALAAWRTASLGLSPRKTLHSRLASALRDHADVTGSL